MKEDTFAAAENHIKGVKVSANLLQPLGERHDSLAERRELAVYLETPSHCVSPLSFPIVGEDN